VLLRPERAALAMSASTVTVTLNALTLGRVRPSDETGRLQGLRKGAGLKRKHEASGYPTRRNI
jgi:hypothetical protein